MKKYQLVTPEALGKLGACFSSAEEIQVFVGQMDLVMEEIKFLMQMRHRVSEKDAGWVLLRQVCVFSMFCQEHLDLLHQLISNIETKEITEEEMKKMME